MAIDVRCKREDVRWIKKHVGCPVIHVKAGGELVLGDVDTDALSEVHVQCHL